MSDIHLDRCVYWTRPPSAEVTTLAYSICGKVGELDSLSTIWKCRNS